MLTSGFVTKLMSAFFYALKPLLSDGSPILDILQNTECMQLALSSWNKMFCVRM